MCEPTIIASVAAQVAGTAIQNKANKRARTARNVAIDNNSKKRMGLEDEARLATMNLMLAIKHHKTSLLNYTTTPLTRQIIQCQT